MSLFSNQKFLLKTLNVGAFLILSSSASAVEMKEFKAGLLKDNTHAGNVCPLVCLSQGGKWSGTWRPLPEEKTAVCMCKMNKETGDKAMNQMPSSGSDSERHEAPAAEAHSTEQLALEGPKTEESTGEAPPLPPRPTKEPLPDLPPRLGTQDNVPPAPEGEPPVAKEKLAIEGGSITEDQLKGVKLKPSKEKTEKTPGKEKTPQEALREAIEKRGDSIRGEGEEKSGAADDVWGDAPKDVE